MTFPKMKSTPQQLAVEAARASDEDLELLFGLGLETTQMGAGNLPLPSLKTWLTTGATELRTTICRSPYVIAYLNDPKTKSRTEWIMLISGVLALTLPSVAAIPATEALLRKGLAEFCAIKPSQD